MSDDAISRNGGHVFSGHDRYPKVVRARALPFPSDKIPSHGFRYVSYKNPDAEFRDAYLVETYRLRRVRSQSFERVVRHEAIESAAVAGLDLVSDKRDLLSGFVPVLLSIICFSGFAFAAFAQLVSGRIVWAIPYILVGIFALTIGQMFGPQHVDRP